MNNTPSSAEDLSINGVSLRYRDVGAGAAVVLLHGWGSSLSAFVQLERCLEPHFRVLSLDLPGFGGSGKPPSAWALADYAKLVEAFFDHFGLQQPVVIGHSFGGRIAIVLGSQGLVSKLVLVDSAGVRPRRSAEYYLKVYAYKLAKQLLRLAPATVRAGLLDKLRRGAGSADYRNADPLLREILVKVVNEDLTPRLGAIKVPTLLIWGENDTATPLEQARIMNRHIADSGLVVLKNAGHYSFIDKPHEFNVIVDHFLRH